MTLPDRVKDSESIEGEFKPWFEAKFEGMDTIYVHGVHRDKEDGYWVEIHDGEKITSYLLEAKLTEWTKMLVKEKPVPVETEEEVEEKK